MKKIMLILVGFILMVNIVGILFADGRDTTVSLKEDISSAISGESNWQQINFSNEIQGNYTEYNKDDYLRDTREPPANDTCENAEYVCSPYPVSGFGTCVEATVNCPGYLGWIGVWYEIELPYENNNIEITICGDGVDLHTTSIILMDDCNCDDYLVHDNGYWITCGNGYSGYYQQWFNFSGPGTILWPVLAVDSDDNGIPFSYEINVSTDDSLPWLNIRNNSYTSDNHIHLRANIENPDYADNTTFYYLSGTSWVNPGLSNPFGNTYDALASIDPNSDFYCRYKSEPSSSPIEMMTACLPNNNFPPNLSELGFVQNDPVGDNVGGSGSNMDITEEYFGFSNNRVFGAIKNNGGGYPTNDGFPYDDYFIYAVGFNNPASDHSDQVYYALVYCDIPFYNDYGLYRIIDGDFTDLGDISYDINGDYLKMAGNFSDLISDPYFGPWNNDGNDILQLQSYTIVAEDYGSNIIYADETDYSFQVIVNNTIEPFTNILPEIVDYDYTQNGSSTTFTATYSDANSHFPIVAELELTDPRTGTREIYQLEPTSTDYSVPVVFTKNVNCHSWTSGLFRFSDNGYQYVTHEISSAAGGTISGTVTEEDGVTPISDATVMAGQYSITTNGNGFYILESVQAGTYDVVCGDTLHFSQTIPEQQVNSGETTNVEFSLKQVLSDGNEAYLKFDGSGDYINVPDNNNLDLTNNYTIEAWFLSNSFEWLDGIVSKYHTPFANGYMVRLSGISPYNGLEFDEMQTDIGIISENIWYHVAAVNDNGTRRLYLNGIEINISGTALSVSSNSDPLTIGVDYLSAPRYFDGKIDEVRIWNTTLSESTIHNWMYENIDVSHPNYANLVSYWKFNDYETPDSAHDSKGNNDGTIINAVYEHITGSPVFHLNPTSLDFGDVVVDDSETLQFTITNNGSGTLSGTITTPADYSVAEVRNIVSEDKKSKSSNLRNEISYSITTSQTYNLTFAPTAILNYDGNVVITSNDPNNPTNNLAVYGNGIGLDVPVVTISEDGVNVTLNWDPVTEATSYTVYSDIDPYGSFSTVEQSGITGTTWSESLSGTMKFYRVTATNVTRTESAPSDVHGFIKYECIQTAGTDLNFIALPMDAGYTNASDLGDDIGDCDAISKWDANNQAWVQASKLPFGWAGDFTLSDGNAYMVNVTDNVNVYIDGPMLSSQPTFDLVATAGTDINSLMLRLDKSGLNLASLLGDDIGVCDAVSNWNALNQAWVQASKLPFGWAGDFAILIGDPLMVNVTENTTWPSTRMITTKTISQKKNS